MPGKANPTFQLAYEQHEPESTPPRGVVVGLHAEGENISAFVENLKVRYPDCHLFVPHAPRPLKHRWNVGLTKVESGRWFIDSDPDEVDPATFGDILIQLDLIERKLEEALGLPVLFYGEGQGEQIVSAYHQISETGKYKI